jgi:glycosyltransferase involved in cell wall biosynthesis
MNHLIVCREYPPAPGGGIGAYTANLAHLLASRGENVHVVSQQWHGAQRPIVRQLGGRLTIHRLPYDNWAAPWGRHAHPALPQPARGLYNTSYPPQAFSWQVAELVELLVESAAIDVIEAPEYEAPLYVFMLRRALGLGPHRQPPCLIHLHSPTEFIARHNGWPATATDVSVAIQLEAYTISAADGLLCPSRSLASEAAEYYQLPAGDITVIPLPLGPDPGRLVRSPGTWASGTICFVGRLEPRKGTFEYLEAAVSVAQERPDLVFEFAGTNVLASDPISSAGRLEQCIPRPVRHQFRFLGEIARAKLPAVFRRARLAVVPSRWENFPYACVEAMRSGLPVLATRQGALPDMIVDGRSGWLVTQADSKSLAEGLRRALATPPAVLEAMGAASAQAIYALCDPDQLAAQHLVVRAELVRRGPTHSRRLPAGLPITHRSRLEPLARRRPGSGPAQGLAVLVAPDTLHAQHAAHQRLSAQLDPLSAAVLTAAAGAGGPAPAPWQVLPPAPDTIVAGRLAVQETQLAAPQPVGIALLSSGDALAPDFVNLCTHVFTACPEVGLIGGWATIKGRPDRLQAPPCPTFPQQWLTNAAILPLAVRAEAFQEAGGLPPGRLAPAVWELANTVLSAGWVGVTLPVVWAERQSPAPEPATLPERARQRFAALLRREAEALPPLELLAGRPVLQPSPRSWTDGQVILRRAARNPATLFHLFWWLARRVPRSIALAPSLWLVSWSARLTKALHLPLGSHG